VEAASADPVEEMERLLARQSSASSSQLGGVLDMLAGMGGSVYDHVNSLFNGWHKGRLARQISFIRR
jgi:hypothetical protein